VTFYISALEIPLLTYLLTYIVDRLAVDPADVISDHSLITCCLPTRRCSNTTGSRVVRSWRKVDRAEFVQAIKYSNIGHAPPPPLSANELFAEYDKALRDIADRFAPVHTAKSRPHPLSPWFDSECCTTRRHCRKLERRFRRSKNDVDWSAYTAALRCKHDDFQVKKNEYWTERISGERGAPAKLWQSLAKILRRDKDTDDSSAATMHTADQFIQYFSNKVEII